MSQSAAHNCVIVNGDCCLWIWLGTSMRCREAAVLVLDAALTSASLEGRTRGQRQSRIESRIRSHTHDLTRRCGRTIRSPTRSRTRSRTRNLIPSRVGHSRRQHAASPRHFSGAADKIIRPSAAGSADDWSDRCRLAAEHVDPCHIMTAASQCRSPVSEPSGPGILRHSGTSHIGQFLATVLHVCRASDCYCSCPQC